MKKTLIISSVILLLGVLAATGYWYWQSQQNGVGGDLQTVALDNSDVSSFDDVCTAGENNELSCTGNIEQFECAYFGIVSGDLTALQPDYPIIRCLKDNVTSTPGGVDQLGKTAYTPAQDIDYITIKDNTFQLIQSVAELQRVYQPIESIDEAKAYFSLLGVGVLVFDQDTLSRITAPQDYHSFLADGQFAVPVNSIGYSQVTKTAEGYILTPYSAIPGFCVDEVYIYTFLLQKDGQLIEQNKKLIWTSQGKSNCYE